MSVINSIRSELQIDIHTSLSTSERLREMTHRKGGFQTLPLIHGDNQRKWTNEHVVSAWQRDLSAITGGSV